MSHWGATVITNLVTAVPYLGTDVAEFGIVMILICYIYGQRKKLNVIGNVSSNARKSIRTISDDYYINLSNAFLGMVVGLIDGDGYIHIGNSGKDWIKLNLVISMHERDLSLLTHIQNILKLGTITEYPKLNICKLIIYRTDLQEIFFPLLIKKNIFFLTKTRNEQYYKALYILQNNISKFSEINYNENKNNTHVNLLPHEYINLHFFRNWLIGFIMAEGSFYIKKNKDACFSLKQRTHLELFESFKLLFNTNNKLYIEKNKYIQYVVSSKKNIQSIINFISFEGNYPLQGYKLIQYINWIEELKKSIRYSDLKLPKI